VFDSEYKKKFGIRLRELRKQAGLSQEELAIRLDLKKSSSISFFETGRSLPTLEQIFGLAQILDVPMEKLLGPVSDQQIKEACGIWWDVSTPPAGSPYATPDLEAGIELFQLIVKERLSTAEIQQQHEQFRNRSKDELRLLLRIALFSHSIRVANVERDQQREQRLYEKFGLRACIVAKLDGLPTDPVIDGIVRTEAIAYLSATAAIQQLEGVSSVGLLGGGIMSRFVDLVQPVSPKLKNITWVSLMATAGIIAPIGMTANSVIERMVYTQPGAIGYRLPYITPSRRTDDHFKSAQGQEREDLEHARSVLWRAQNVDAAFMGVGALMNLTPEAVPLFKALQQLSADERQRVKGDILLRLVDEDGERVGTAEDQAYNDTFVYSIDFDDLRSLAAKSIIWVVAGEVQKASVIRGALKAQLVNSLVIEPTVADELLN